jgi:hypothetical protein
MLHGKRLSAAMLASCVLACGVASQANAQAVGRCIGIGHSEGYNAPCSGRRPCDFRPGCPSCRHGHGNQGCENNFAGGGYGHLQWGCCEFPANWRYHVWDDYPNEPLAQRWAGGELHPEAPIPSPFHTLFKRQGTPNGHDPYAGQHQKYSAPVGADAGEVIAPLPGEAKRPQPVRQASTGVIRPASARKLLH